MKDHSHRTALADEIYRRYGSRAVGFSRRWRFWRKKYAWAFVVGGAKVMKRSIDVTGSLVLLLLFSPLLIAAALLVKLTDGGPVLYWQRRVGKWGREFPCPKFRCMALNRVKPNSGDGEKHSETSSFSDNNKPASPFTWIGRGLRHFHLDELPQLVCVLKGDMSLVGPHPPTPHEVAFYSLAERRRLNVTPGMTCIWQVSDRRDQTDDRQIDLDLQYIESQSLWFDIKLLLKTLRVVLFGKGAF